MDDGKRSTQAQEFTTLSELQTFYDKRRREDAKNRPVLRIVHAQNARWAREFLFARYDIPYGSEQANSFGRWAMFEKPQRRAGKPVLQAKAFRTEKDPVRHIWRCGFGMDYLRSFPPQHMEHHITRQRAANLGHNVPDPKNFMMFPLNHWVENDDSSYPAHGYDVYVQRMSVYIQRNMEGSGLPDDWREIYRTPAPPRYSMDSNSDGGFSSVATVDENRPSPSPSGQTSVLGDEECDNTTTILILESSQSGLVRDTMIGARDEIECKWRRLFADLPREDYENDSDLSLQCIDVALKYVFTGMTASWDKTLTRCEEHVTVLEDRIYEDPADESRAPELWQNSGLWLKVESLIWAQLGVVQAMKEYMREIALGDKEFWDEVPGQYQKITSAIQEDIIKPTQNLSDLVS